jgi:enolase
LASNEEALQRVTAAIAEAGYKAGEQVSIALDCASSEFYENGKYTFDKKPFTANELVDVYAELAQKYHIVSI